MNKYIGFDFDGL